MRLLFFLISLYAWEASAATHFAIIGDRTGRAVPGVYEQVWREVRAAKPDFAVTVGDAIEGGNSATASAEWGKVRSAWPPDFPIYHTPGNQDIWDTKSEALYAKATGHPAHYAFDAGGAHFVVLDNSRTDDLAPEQLRFLENDLRAQAHHKPVFILFHRPLWLILLKLRATAFPLHRIAREYGVCCVISGHGHQLQETTEGGLLYLEVGSSGASLGGAGPAGLGYDEGWFYQWVWVTVDGNHVTFEIRELGPPRGQSRIQKFQTAAP